MSTPDLKRAHVNCLCTGTPVCVVCGRSLPSDLEPGCGWWATFEDGNCDPVCRGQCWRSYVEAKAVRAELAKWAALYPGTVFAMETVHA